MTLRHSPVALPSDIMGGVRAVGCTHGCRVPVRQAGPQEGRRAAAQVERLGTPPDGGRCFRPRASTMRNATRPRQIAGRDFEPRGACVRATAVSRRAARSTRRSGSPLRGPARRPRSPRPARRRARRRGSASVRAWTRVKVVGGGAARDGQHLGALAAARDEHPASRPRLAARPGENVAERARVSAARCGQASPTRRGAGDCASTMGASGAGPATRAAAANSAMAMLAGTSQRTPT